MCWRKVIVTGSLATGAVHVDLLNSTRSGSGSENAPLLRWPGSLTESVASPAVEITLAFAEVTYSRSTPGWKAPKLALPSVRASVAGTVPPTPPLPVAMRVTVNVAVAVLPAASVAEQLTMVTPSSQLTGTSPSTSSVAAGTGTGRPTGTLTSWASITGGVKSQPCAIAKRLTVASSSPLRVETRWQPAPTSN